MRGLSLIVGRFAAVVMVALACAGGLHAQERAPDGTPYLYPGMVLQTGVTYTLHPSGRIDLPGWDGRSDVTADQIRAGQGGVAVAAKGCACGVGCACPAGACASGACGTQPIGTPAARPGTVLVEQTIQRADGSTYTRIVERPAGYVPMSGVRQSQQSGPLASGTAPRPHAAGTDDHTHTCPRCGTTWGGRGHSHSCPRCGTPQYVQDQPGYAPAYYPGRPGYAAQGGVTYPQPVQYQPQYRPIYSFGGGGGCASGGCANGACGVPQFSPWR